MNMPMTHLQTVLHQHAEETAFLWWQRRHLVHAPHLTLRLLARHDERLDAHIDGLRVAGDEGWAECEAQLDDSEAGTVFAAAVSAIEQRHAARIERLLTLAETKPALEPGLVAAFGYVSPQFPASEVKALLISPSSFRQRIGIACCAMYRIDPGSALDTAVNAPDVKLRARGLRAIGELGRRDLLGECERQLETDASKQEEEDDEADSCRFWSAWSAALLGNRSRALNVLSGFATRTHPFRRSALELALKAMSLPDAHHLLRALAQDPANIRWLVMGVGIVGDPHYLSWLIKQMENPALARLAGEAFCLMTGIDLARQNLEGKPPQPGEDRQEDLTDENVGMDEDDHLPWPDTTKMHAWWNSSQNRFQAGTRYFMGQVSSIEHCRQVLRNASQRQRASSALTLAMLQPGVPLFATDAPVPWQQRWLSGMD